MTREDALARFRSFYETFSAEWLTRLDQLYAPSFELSDPFHTFTSLPPLRAYLQRLIDHVVYSQFHVEDIATGGDGSYVRWRWEWQRKSRDPRRVLPGITHLRFAADHRITYHRDIFDAASGIYETIPVLGTALRAIKRRV